MIWRCDLVPQYEMYKEEINEAIQRVFLSGRYILSEEVAAFEEEFARYVGTGYAVGVANATDGLTISLMAIGVGKNDEIITTPFTAIPTVSAIIDSGARPIFIDVDPDTFLMDLNKISSTITPRTKAIMPVHIFGNVVDIPRLKKIIGSDIPIIEDASQAHGSELSEVKTGSMGSAGIFSFYPTKNLGGYGDGGMVVTNDQKLAEKVRLLRMYGMTDKDHIVINGVNSRLDEMQATILRVKLKYLDAMNKRRNEIAERYTKRLDSGLLQAQEITENAFSNYHIYASRYKGRREKFLKHLESKKIQTNIYYPVPLHLQKANEFLGMKKGDLPVAEKLCDEVIALPMYAELKEDVQDFIIDTVNKYAG